MSETAADGGRPLRVALYNVTTTTKVGGVESFVWEITARLAARGHSVDVIGGRGAERRDLPGVRVVTLPYLDREFWRRIPLLGRQFTLTKLLERLSFGLFGFPYLLAKRYDIVHIQKPYDLPVGALVRLFGRRVIFGCHGKDFWLGDKLFVRQIDAAVSASAFNAEQVRERYGISPEVIYNGVDTERFTPVRAPDEDAVLDALGLRDDLQPGKRNILWVGRLIRWKGFEYLIAALPLLKTSAVKVWVAGMGPYQDDLEALAQKLGVQDQIRFLGNVPQEQLHALYHAADLVAATSFVNETFGIALAEAMASGRPVVASRFGGFSEVVDDSVTGLLTTPQDPQSLATALDKVLADRALADRMGAAGLERVSRLFTWDSVVDRLEPIYRRALDGRGKKAVKPRRYLYVAYTLSLTLKAANAVQTFQTVRNLRELATAAGDDVTLVLPRLLREESRFGAALGATVKHLPRIPFNKLTRLWKSSIFSYVERTAFSVELLLWIVWQRLRGCGFSAVYVRDVVCAYWLLRAQALVGAPILYEAHDLEQLNPSRARGGIWSRLISSFDRVALTRSTRVVSLTEEFRGYLSDEGMRQRKDVAVVPDAFDNDAYQEMPKEAARTQLGLPDDAFVVGYAGLTFAYRRLDLLVEAFSKVAREAGLDEARRMVLALVGGRPAEVDELRQQARSLGLAVVDRPQAARGPQVILTGQIGQDGVVPWLYAADVLAIPDTVSSLTASPLKLFEYMAAGRAIVLRELPALREILDDDSALFFAPGDVAALAAALERLRRDPALREKLGSEARQRSVRYTYRERARQVLALLRAP